ncbi:MAG: hypothetical protein HYU64_15900 [Armatimonadetes bacterium]|nr:hypothetical protein [Armatimonadota bacterium]
MVLGSAGCEFFHPVGTTRPILSRPARKGVGDLHAPLDKELDSLKKEVAELRKLAALNAARRNAPHPKLHTQSDSKAQNLNPILDIIAKGVVAVLEAEEMGRGAKEIPHQPRSVGKSDTIKAVAALSGSNESEAPFILCPQLAKLRGILKVENFELPAIQEHVRDLTKLPTGTVSRLLSAGLKGIRIADKSIRELAPGQSFTAQKPRGWSEGATWDDVHAAYFPGSGIVCVGKGRHDSYSAVLHEIGHAIGDLLGFDDHPLLIEAHKRLYNKLDSYLKQGGPGGKAGREELLAESTALYLKKGRKEAENTYDGEYVKFLEDTVLAG